MMSLEERYTTGSHLHTHPGWHTDESPWKIKHIMRMLRRHHLTPQTICEVGCGAGEVLRLLQQRMDEQCTFWGYEISPQAFAMCQEKANDHLHFALADLRQQEDAHFDLLLVLDVVEHVEDYLGFLRAMKARSEYKLFQIPLEISVQGVLRGKTFIRNRDIHGHLHHFTKETALRTLEDTGYEVLDTSYVPEFEMTTNLPLTRLMKGPRQALFTLNQDWASRVLGGCRILILAR